MTRSSATACTNWKKKKGTYLPCANSTQVEHNPKHKSTTYPEVCALQPFRVLWHSSGLRASCLQFLRRLDGSVRQTSSICGSTCPPDAGTRRTTPLPNTATWLGALSRSQGSRWLSEASKRAHQRGHSWTGVPKNVLPGRCNMIPATQGRNDTSGMTKEPCYRCAQGARGRNWPNGKQVPRTLILT